MKDLPCADDVDLVLTTFNREDHLIPSLPLAMPSPLPAAAASDVVAYWDSCRHQLPPFIEHLLCRVAASHPADVVEGTGTGDMFACSDCSKRYSSASNLARHRITHQPSATSTTTTTTVTTPTSDRRVSRQCPHCAKVLYSRHQSLCLIRLLVVIRAGDGARCLK